MKDADESRRALEGTREWLRRWLLTEAYPLRARQGFNESSGAFVEFVG